MTKLIVYTRESTSPRLPSEPECIKNTVLLTNKGDITFKDYVSHNSCRVTRYYE